MTIEEQVPLAKLTTLRIGGAAHFLATCTTEDDVYQALSFAAARGLPWRVLGEGSNVLVDDRGFAGVVLVLALQSIAEVPQGNKTHLQAGAGVSWDLLVREAAERGLWGIENLAGIPGTVGAAPVQNIGAYGTEVKDTIHAVRVLDAATGTVRTFMNEDCAFGYRTSRFMREPNHIILSVSFALTRDGKPALGYKDLARAAESGSALSSPALIGDAVRAIRALKFPDLKTHGTAGSFFKNPTVSEATFAHLHAQYPELPGFPNEHGVKLPLAFVLDRVLNLRGYREGNVWLFDAQPLVLVADAGATADDVRAFADGIRARVHAATGITIEREVRDFVAHE